MTSDNIRPEPSSVSDSASEPISTDDLSMETFFTISPDLFCIASTDGYFKKLNPAWEVTLGYSINELLSKPFAELIHPDDVEPTFKEVAKQLEGQETMHFVNRYRCHDGSYKWLEWRAKASSDQNSLFAVARDISDSKLSTELIWERDRVLHAVTTSVRDAIIMMDNNGHISFWNKSSVDLFGFSEDEVLGKNLHELLTTRFFLEEFRKAFPVFQTSGEGAAIGKTLELVAVRKDGSEFPIELSLSAVKVSNQWHSIGIINDISERKRSEKLLKDSEEKYRNLIENMGEGIGLVNAKEIFLFANPSAEKIFGVDKGKLAGLCLNDFLHEGAIEEISMETEKRRNGEVSTYETEIFLPDGNKKDLLVTATPRYDGDNFIGTFGIFRDITERKQAEAALKDSEVRLKELNATKDKFFSIISHDLRSPFNVFLGFTKVIEEDMHSMTREEIFSLVQKMGVSASNLFSLLENLLEWSMIQREMTIAYPERLLVKTKVEAIMEVMGELAKNKKIDTIINLTKDLVIHSDEKMFDSVLRNLYSNSVKFTPLGGKITISARPISADFAEISIKDTGIGMTREMIENLFKIDIDTGRQGTGGEPSAGLGLILCKDFVEKNGGRLWVESEPEKGSVFYFTVPRKATD